MAFGSCKSSLHLGAALAVALCQPAHAQDTQESAGRGSGDDEEIVVTARRTEELLQDVPISMTVFNQDQLTDRNVITATDLATYTPSLSVNQRFGPEKSSFSIRGFVQELGTTPSVGVYFAEVVSPRASGGTTAGNTAAVGSFMDLQNVQVLKGPQGTLFGRNTTGGAVLLVPRKPTDRFEGYTQFSAGDYNMLRMEGVLNVPLSESFRVRLGIDRNVRDGYMKNHSGIGNDSYNDVNYFAARLSVVADLTDDLENYTIATLSHSFANGYGARVVVCNPNLAGVVQAILGPAGCNQLARHNARGDGLLDVEINNPDPYVNIKQWQVINTTTWNVSDELTIKNIVSYAEFREKSSINLAGDNFRVPTPAPVVPGLPPLPAGAPFQFVFLQQNGDQYLAAQKTFTEELQFQGTMGDFNWQAGAYLELARPIGFNAGHSGNLVNCTIPAILACNNPIFVGSVQKSATKFWFNNKGLYAQGTFKFSDQFSLTAGIRYTIDKTRTLAQSTRVALPSLTLTCNDVVRFNVPDGPDPGTAPDPLVVTDPSQCRVIFRQKSKRPTWLVGLDFNPTEDILLYAKYARGYRQGGVNPTNIGLETWGPEKVDAYELGAKVSFSGAVRGYFNIAAFYNNFTDQQVVVNGISNVPGFSGSQPVVNAGKSRIQGIEVDSSITLFDSLRFDLGYTYLSTKLKSITVPPIPPGAPYSALIPTAVVGERLALSPKHRLTLTGTYTLPLDESVGEISLSATWIHTSNQVATLATLPELQTLPKTDLINLNVNWNGVMGQPIDLAAFVTNLTNESYPVAVGSLFFSTGVENQLFAAPRMWGFRVRYNFGE